MAKHLKLKIKNTQLAAVLKKNKAKQEPAKSEKQKERPSPQVKKEVPAAAETLPEEEEQKPKRVVRARKKPSHVLEAEEKARTTTEGEEEHESLSAEDEQAVVEKREKLDQTDKEAKTPESPPEQPPEEVYRPKKSEHIIKRRMIATPIVKKKEPVYRRPKKAEETRPPQSNAPSPPPTPAEEVKIGSKKRIDKKKEISFDEEGGKSDKSKKSSPSSYRRQAFSRVFDSRSIDGEETWRRRRHHKQKKKKSDEPIIRPKEVSVTLPITVKELASQMKVKGTEVIQKLFMQGLPITINDALEDETTVQLIGHEFSCKINIDKSQEQRLQITDLSIREEIAQTDPKDLETRPPIVTVMGHVDHGKTSIIDSFRKSHLTSGEAGAITQHIGAFQVKTQHGRFTVLDTPGHEAFSAIRSRGADVTDIVVLVIAGDEGIMPQTREAIEKAKEAHVPIIVALNKMDKPGFNPDEIYRQLAEYELLPEAWGGNTLTVNCSAKTGEGIETLAELIALQSEVLELKANPHCRVRGTVLEAEMHRGLGITATLLVQNGTLHIGDALIFELEYAKIKTMQDEHGKKVESALPSTAVKVTGLSGVPASGSEFIMLEDEREARKIAEERRIQARFEELKKRRSKSLEHLVQHTVDRQRKKTLNIILKADVGGSLEAVRETLLNIPTDKVELNFISSDVGQISESDIEMAHASGAIIVGFHTNVESHAEQLLKTMKVKIILFDVIYHLVDEVKEHMISILDKLRKETQVAAASVLATFKSSHLGIIAGCKVTEGVIKRSQFVRQFRDGEEIWSGSLASLKRHHDDVKEVKKDLECGIVLQGSNDIRENDEFKFYEISYITQEL